MLLEFPNPKDPQDAEVAKMLMEDPERFALMAHEWAVKYGGAPRSEVDLSKYQKAGEGSTLKTDQVSRYVNAINFHETFSRFATNDISPTDTKATTLRLSIGLSTWDSKSML